MAAKKKSKTNLRRSARVSPGGNARPPYTITPAQVTALPPGKGPPMSSTPSSGAGGLSFLRKRHAKRAHPVYVGRSLSSRGRRGR